MGPPAGSADRAVRRGAARRRRTAFSTVATLGLAGMATGAALRLPSGPGGTVGAADAPRVVPATSTSASGSPTPTVAPQPTLGVHPTASGTIGVPPVTLPSATPVPDPQPKPSTTTAAPAPGGELTTEDTTYGYECHDRASSRTANGWCVNYVGALAGRSGQDVTLSIELCRLPGFRTAAASFPTSQEADFTVSTTGPSARRVWRWSDGRAFADARHEVPIGAGTCVRWSTRWGVRDGSGRPLPAGRYDLLPDVLADNLSGGADYLRETFSFTVS
jgi:hypothetical protein